ncbi:MAG: molecular chaperone HtpG [Polyangiales bacterium]
METETTPAETGSKETHRFQAEVSQVLNLVIHSLYSHREVFLRELISNASDALDKLRFKAITEPSLLPEGDAGFAIRVTPDADAHTLTIEDNGVGMTHDELVQNLGTIAHSGSKKFVEALTAKGAKSDVSLIGQFGVGFYSAWLVADRVTVTSRAAGGDKAWTWSSDAKDSFTVEPAERAEHGTTVTLHLRDEHKEFLEGWKLRDLIARYSDFVGHPIQVKKEKEEPEEGEAPAEGEGYETVNQARALWQRPKSEVTAEQYQEFYKHLTGDWEEPAAWTHFKVEGTQEFTGLLFVPKTVPFDLDHPTGSKRGVRLFVRRVFIMDDCEALLPTWLRFVRGVVDSDDLPLNVSRETLQDSAVVRAIKKGLTKRSLDLLDELAKDRADDFATFWRSFGRVLKEGLANDWEWRERLTNLVRFESSRGEGLTSLSEYVSRMPEDQSAIYYVLSDSLESAQQSPHIEALTSRGYEVLYLTDVVDPWAVDAVREFQGKKLTNAADAELKLDDAKKPESSALSEALKPLVERFKGVLGERVREVRSTDRLTDSPACLVTPPGQLDPLRERILRAAGRDVPPVKRILELNPTHPLIKALQSRVDAGADEAQVGEWIELLHDQALLSEGAPVDNPARFAKRIAALMQQALAPATESAPQG